MFLAAQVSMYPLRQTRLSQILGHTKVSTTQIYARMTPEGLKKRHDQASPAKQIVNDGSNTGCRR